MNNRIDNFLLAWSTREEIRKLRKAPNVSWEKGFRPFSLSSYLPAPVSLRLLEYEYESPLFLQAYKETGYFSKNCWQSGEWGVRYDVTGVFEREGDNNYWALKFNTKDTPPSLAIKKISKMHPSVSFNHKYFDTANSVAGSVTYLNGRKNAEVFKGTRYNELIGDLKKRGLHISNDSVRMEIDYTNHDRKHCTTDVFTAAFYDHEL
jgi:hypothetical protein